MTTESESARATHARGRPAEHRHACRGHGGEEAWPLFRRSVLVAVVVEEWLVVERLAQRGRGHGRLGDDSRRVVHHQLLVLVVHQGRAVLREQAQRHAVLQGAVVFRADGRITAGLHSRECGADASRGRRGLRPSLMTAVGLISFVFFLRFTRLRQFSAPRPLHVYACADNRPTTCPRGAPPTSDRRAPPAPPAWETTAASSAAAPSRAPRGAFACRSRRTALRARPKSRP